MPISITIKGGKSQGAEMLSSKARTQLVGTLLEEFRLSLAKTGWPQSPLIYLVVLQTDFVMPSTIPSPARSAIIMNIEESILFS